MDNLQELGEGELLLYKDGQYIINQINSSRNALLDMLRDAPVDQITLYHANSMPPSLPYGGMLNFMKNDGDLRVTGFEQGHTVAYVEPIGILSAVAYLAIASQCTFTPLDPNYTKADFVLAFDQIKPSVVVVFDGIDKEPIYEAGSLQNQTCLCKGAPKHLRTLPF